MIRLNGATETLEIQTSAAGSIDWIVNFDVLLAADLTPDGDQGNIAAASTITAVAGGADPVQVRFLTLFNAGTAANAVTVKKDVSATERVLYRVTLQPGDLLQYTSNTGFNVLDKGGRQKTVHSDSAGITGRTVSMYKVGGTAEAIGVLHCMAFNTGAPGAWATGSPGLNGRATDGMSAADAGCFPLWTPAGALYLVEAKSTATVACSPMYYDVLWVNTALVVTTTGAQAIGAPVALPARDGSGTADGEGVMVALLVTAATTNAGAITNCTLSYTNSLGVAGRTATMASFPATAAGGTVVLFQLQAGDTGFRSPQSVALGTSMVTGSVSLIALKQAAMNNVPVVAGGQPPALHKTGCRLYTGACLLPFYLPTATTALNLFAMLSVEER